MLKESKEENLKGLVDTLLNTHIAPGKNVAIYMKNEELDGDLSKVLIEQIGSNGYQKSEMQEVMAKVNRVKIQPEIDNLDIASNFTEWSFKKVIRDLESYIEKDVKIKHKKVSNNAERMIENNDRLASFLAKHGIQDSQLLEYPLPILIQSGGTYSINKFNAECDDNFIESDVVYINICGKYNEMQAMASRTLLFNPTDAQKAAYELAFEAQMHLISCLKPGSTISSVYKSTMDLITSKDSELAQ